MMDAITDDNGVRAALQALELPIQREVGASLVANVLELADDPRIGNALAGARDEDAHDSESAAQYKILTSYLKGRG